MLHGVTVAKPQGYDRVSRCLNCYAAAVIEVLCDSQRGVALVVNHVTFVLNRVSGTSVVCRKSNHRFSYGFLGPMKRDRKGTLYAYCGFDQSRCVAA